VIKESHDEIKSFSENSGDKRQAEKIVNRITKRISPFNDIGLMDPQNNHMYEHTAVNL